MTSTDSHWFTLFQSTLLDFVSLLIDDGRETSRIQAKTTSSEVLPDEEERRKSASSEQLVDLRVEMFDLVHSLVDFRSFGVRECLFDCFSSLLARHELGTTRCERTQCLFGLQSRLSTTSRNILCRRL